jgi:D-beta-D-heptose 7-phosphate kinase/D-beta-D-heptose 1-phosphate adenosyltransferase
VRERFAAIGVDAAGVLTVEDRPTTRKTRVVAHNQQVVRADWESVAPLRERDAALVANLISARAMSVDAIILSDYAKGLFSRGVVETTLCAPIVVADPKPQNVALFAGVTCVAPNQSEAARASGVRITGDASLEEAGRVLLERLQCAYVLVTRGEAGMALFGRAGERIAVPSVARTVYDVSGAGDTVVAVLTLALAAHAPIAAAVQLANFAAGAVVEKLGTATASPDEVIALVEHGANMA